MENTFVKEILASGPYTFYIPEEAAAALKMCNYSCEKLSINYEYLQFMHVHKIDFSKKIANTTTVLEIETRQR